jgi:hypothetical protein
MLDQAKSAAGTAVPLAPEEPPASISQLSFFSAKSKPPALAYNAGSFMVAFHPKSPRLGVNPDSPK